MTDRIQGVDGLRPRAPIGVVATVGHRGASGAPVDKDRWFLMAPDAPAKPFGGRSMYTREFHGEFKAWNDAATAGSDRTRTLSGVIVHADFRQAIRLSRVAMKLPDLKSPPTRRPCCEGNGLTARRFSRVENGLEIFDEIQCPGRLCPYAQGDAPVCKPTVHLLFMLRWPTWQDHKASIRPPEMLCAWSSRSPRSIENLLGLFALVLGAKAVAPDSDPSTWEPGLAASVGIASPSLVGLPFTMTVGERTNAEKKTRYPSVRFSAGDLEGWLRSQASLRELVGAPALAALPAAPVDADDAEFAQALPALRLDVASPEDAIPDAEEIESTARTLSQDQVFELVRECRETNVDPEELARELGVSALHLLPLPEGAAAEGLPNRLRSTVRALAARKTAK